MKRIHYLAGFCILLIALSACKKQGQEAFIGGEQKDILTKEGIDSVLSTFPSVPYSQLNKTYKDSTDPERRFSEELNSQELYLITGDEIYTKVIGHYRVKDFLAKDHFYKTNLKNPGAKNTQCWLIDKNVLYMMLELIHKLDEGGYDKYGFHIRTSHRHPAYNQKLNGAKYSQHMFGRAIDIGVDDVDRDGEADLDDKAILYDLLQDIVGNKGGLGLYPGKMSLHFDCRGHRARWDWP